MASRAALRGKIEGPKAIRPEDKHESELNEEDRHRLSGDIDCIVGFFEYRFFDYLWWT